ncbi:MAG: hypothetical protein ACE5LU_02675 [Anaerolineae bacterium]
MRRQKAIGRVSSVRYRVHAGFWPGVDLPALAETGRPGPATVVG